MEHVRTVVQPAHIPIRVMDIIRVVAVHLRVRHVRDVLRGHARQPAHVRAEQSASHAMRVIICPMAHASNAKLDTIVPGTTVGIIAQVHPHMHQIRSRPVTTRQQFQVIRYQVGLEQLRRTHVNICIGIRLRVAIFMNIQTTAVALADTKQSLHKDGIRLNRDII